MTLQERKLKLINQLSITQNKKLIKQIENLLQQTIIEEYESFLKPMTEKEFTNKIKEAEEDIKAGRTHTQEEVEIYFKKKFKK